MKKLVIASLMAVSGVALADGYQPSSFVNSGAAEAFSAVEVGSGSMTANIGNGAAIQSSKTWADNQSFAGVRASNGVVETAAGSEGASGSSSLGLSFGALGATAGFAGQTGAAGAEGSSVLRSYRPR
jgi:hypothetical protein